MLVDEEELASVRNRCEEFTIFIDNKSMADAFIEEDFHHSAGEQIHVYFRKRFTYSEGSHGVGGEKEIFVTSERFVCADVINIHEDNHERALKWK